MAEARGRGFASVETTGMIWGDARSARRFRACVARRPTNQARRRVHPGVVELSRAVIALFQGFLRRSGGEDGIRTHDTALDRITV